MRRNIVSQIKAPSPFARWFTTEKRAKTRGTKKRNRKKGKKKKGKEKETTTKGSRLGVCSDGNGWLWVCRRCSPAGSPRSRSSPRIAANTVASTAASVDAGIPPRIKKIHLLYGSQSQNSPLQTSLPLPWSPTPVSSYCQPDGSHIGARSSKVALDGEAVRSWGVHAWFSPDCISMSSHLFPSFFFLTIANKKWQGRSRPIFISHVSPMLHLWRETERGSTLTREVVQSYILAKKRVTSPVFWESAASSGDKGKERALVHLVV